MRNRTWLLAVGIVAAFFPSAGAQDRDAAQADLVELGRHLFMDPAVSRSGRFSCASCHLPEYGFSDPRVRSVEHDGPSRRHSQPLTDLVDGTGMHRDGEFDTVRELIEARLLPGSNASFSIHTLRARHFRRALKGGKEPDPQSFDEALKSLEPPAIKGNLKELRDVIPFAPVADRLQDDDRYRTAFKKVYGTQRPKIEQLIDALEAYVLSLRTEPNALDRFLAGELDALTEQQRRGYALFVGEARCASCHTVKPRRGRSLLTDLAYHNTGVVTPNLVVLGGRLRAGDGGRGEMTHAATDLGRFKTPSLRDVARRPPYMHDGSLKTLEEVVEFYDRGGRPHEHLDPKIQPLRLSDTDKGALVALLRALSAPGRAGVGPARPVQRTKLRIVDVNGRPLPGLTVRVRPFGDRLGRTEGTAGMQRLLTDKKGNVEFEFPAWTHVTVEATGYEVGCGRPIPGSARALELRAVPWLHHVVEIIEAPSVPKTMHAFKPGTDKVVAVLKRIRRLGGQRALYEVFAARSPEPVPVKLSIDPRVRGVVELDLRGGESDPIRVPSQDETQQGYG